MKKAVFLSVIFLLSTISCVRTVVTHNSVKNRYASYGMEPLPASWQKKSFRHAELFFEHKDASAFIYLNSQCEKLSDSPLEALTSQALVGMGRYDIISQERLKIDDREALVSEVEVKLDGVSRYVKIMVLRKNACVFDVVFSSSDRDKYLVKDFDAMIETFWAKADL